MKNDTPVYFNILSELLVKYVISVQIIDQDFLIGYPATFKAGCINLFSFIH